MKSYDWKPERNPNLLPYLNSNMGKMAFLLKQMGVIDKIPNPVPQLVIPDRK
jgi:hypothetical protein